MGLFEFITSAVILSATSALWLRRRQVSALLFAALAVYASLASFKYQTLSLEYGEEAYARSGAIFLTGTILLVLCMDLARRGLGINGGESPGFIWSRSTYIQHSKNGLIFALLGVLLLVADRPDLSVAWNAARNQNSQFSVLAILFLLMAMPACISALRTGRKAIVFALLVTCSFAFVLTGSRALVMSGLLLAAWMFIQRFRNPLGRVVTIVLVLPVAFAAHSALRFFRGLGPDGIVTATNNGSLISRIVRSMSETDSSGGELAIARYFVYSTTVSSDDEFGTLTTV